MGFFDKVCWGSNWIGYENWGYGKIKIRSVHETIDFIKAMWICYIKDIQSTFEYVHFNVKSNCWIVEQYLSSLKRIE